MTDPYPAIRKQVEALERAAHDFRYRLLLARIDGAEEDTPESCPTLDRARAALNSRVEALMLRAVEIGAEELEEMPDEPRRTHAEDVTLWKKVTQRLLNEEPDE